LAARPHRPLRFTPPNGPCLWVTRPLFRRGCRLARVAPLRDSWLSKMAMAKLTEEDCRSASGNLALWRTSVTLGEEDVSVPSRGYARREPQRTTCRNPGSWSTRHTLGPLEPPRSVDVQRPNLLVQSWHLVFHGEWLPPGRGAMLERAGSGEGIPDLACHFPFPDIFVNSESRGV
jgi:hypothetical protein